MAGRLEAADIGFESLTERIDTSTAASELVFYVFGAIAQFERRLIVERTQAGLVAARARGRAGGRPAMPASTITAIRALAATNRSPGEICQALNISRSTFYKYAEEATSDGAAAALRASSDA
ncbi:recombinase family protein [Massilia rhizosphaerae]|uniref:recombinase family protein n=1 Tax=Massilia rhizosphaerae TaxID=2784389 RepID=UPI003F8C6D0F